MDRNYLAIDIGGTNLKYGIVNRAGELIEKHSTPTVTTDLPAFMAQLTAIVASYQDQIKGVGIAVPGKVDHHDETIYGGGALQFLDQVNLPAALQLAVPVSVENDGKAAALAELWLGNLKNVQNGAAVVLGTGVGGGLILNGQLYAGSHFQAGELSFMVLDTDLSNPEHWLGSQGSAVRMIERIATVLGLPDKHDGKAVFEAINQGDRRALPIFSAYTQTIAHMIYNLQTVIDVDRVVIGGGISAQKIVAATIQADYQALMAQNDVIANVLTPIPILTSRFGNDTNLYGAIYHLLMTINQEV